MISTSNPVYQIWKIVIIITSFIACFSYAYKAMHVDEKYSSKDDYEIYFEITQLLDVFITFFVEYHYPMQQRIERRFLQLCKLYLHGQFLVDVIAIIPFYAIFEGLIDYQYNRLFLLIKIVRITRGFELMSTKVFMTQVKSHFSKKIMSLIQNNEEHAND